jgi:hypothetical protein
VRGRFISASGSPLARPGEAALQSQAIDLRHGPRALRRLGQLTFERLAKQIGREPANNPVPSAPFAGCSANARFFSRVGGAALTQASRCLSAEISRGTAAITSANLSPGLRSTAALERASSRAATGRRDLWPGGSGGGVASADAQPPR